MSRPKRVAAKKRAERAEDAPLKAWAERAEKVESEAQARAAEAQARAAEAQARAAEAQAADVLASEARAQAVRAQAALAPVKREVVRAIKARARVTAVPGNGRAPEAKRRVRAAKAQEWAAETHARAQAMVVQEAEARAVWAWARVQEAEARAQEAEARVLVVAAWAAEAREARGRKVILRRVDRALVFVELIVPRRIADEELGDAMEQIHRMIEQRRPQWHIYLKVASTIFWVILNAFRASGRRTVMKKVVKRKS